MAKNCQNTPNIKRGAINQIFSIFVIILELKHLYTSDFYWQLYLIKNGDKKGGIFGIVSKQDCVDDLFLGTFYLQHRAQDFCGIALVDNKKQSYNTHRGLIRQQFPKEKIDSLSGTIGLGCVSSDRQPVSELSKSGGMSFAFDGNIVNHDEIRDNLLKSGGTFTGYHAPGDISDCVLAGKIISRELDFEKGIASFVKKINGDFAIVGLCDNAIYAARGFGRKPLILGQKNQSYAVSSESNSFINSGFNIVRDVAPGEIVCINNEGIKSVATLEMSPLKYCTFEWIYTAYPASTIDQKTVSEVRKKLGRLLAKRYPVEADLVSPIPNSGRWHALGYAQESKIPYEEAFIRYDYSDRSYTPQEQSARDTEAKTKLIPIKESIIGKRIVIVDDSIVRGTQLLNKVLALRDCGAKEVHARIACPPLMHACMYGKSTRKDTDCIAVRMELDDIKETLKLDSLGYATIEDLETATGYSKDKLCTNCW